MGRGGGRVSPVEKVRGRRPPAHYTPAHIAPFAGPRRAGQQGTDGDAGAGAVAAVQDRRQGRRIEGAGLGHCGADSTLDRRSRLQHHTSMLRHHGMTEIGLHAVFRAVVVSRLTYALPAWSAFITATDRQLGLPDLPYFTGDSVFQTSSPASRGKTPGRTNLPYSVSQIVV